MTIKSRFLNWLLPDKIKRMIFLSSLAAYIRDLQKPDKETLKKLNEILLLCSNEEALRFPIEIHSKIWGRFDIECLQQSGIDVSNMREFHTRGLAKSEMRIVANRFIDYMPVWLKYQSKESIRQDIYRLFLGLEVITEHPKVVHHS